MAEEGEVSKDGRDGHAVLRDFCERYDLEYSKFLNMPPIGTHIVAFPSLSEVPDGSVESVGAGKLDINGESFLPVNWLHPFRVFSSVVDESTFRVSQSPLYKAGHILSVDAASIAAVVALGVDSSHSVLDMCCAPGAKLSLIALCRPRRLVGMDVSLPRLQTCQNILRKYGIRKEVCLMRCDASAVLQSTVKDVWKMHTSLPHIVDVVDSQTCARMVINKNARRHARKRRRIAEPGEVDTEENDGFMFDRILLDVECSHDGSIRHVNKFDERFLDHSHMSQLIATQRKSIRKAWTLLKPGGIMVYSTCSFTKCQNEDIVEEFIKETPSASVDEIPQAEHWPCSCIGGNLTGSLRFDPWVSKTSGLYISRIKKACMSCEDPPS
eukprot:ANDGO_02570.mRNA.1 Ribosomal RNA small subunit methyltransferase B